MWGEVRGFAPLASAVRGSSWGDEDWWQEADRHVSRPLERSPAPVARRLKPPNSTAWPRRSHRPVGVARPADARSPGRRTRGCAAHLGRRRAASVSGGGRRRHRPVTLWASGQCLLRCRQTEARLAPGVLAIAAACATCSAAPARARRPHRRWGCARRRAGAEPAVRTLQAHRDPVACTGALNGIVPGPAAARPPALLPLPWPAGRHRSKPHHRHAAVGSLRCSLGRAAGHRFVASGGMPAQGRASWYALQTRSTNASACRGPTTCRPTGSRSPVRPQGTLAAGCWVRLNG